MKTSGFRWRRAVWVGAFTLCGTSSAWASAVQSFELRRTASAIVVTADLDGDHQIAALDLDDDNDIDLVIVSRSGQWTALINQGNGVFWPKRVPLVPHVAPVRSADTVVAAAGATMRAMAAIVRTCVEVHRDSGVLASPAAIGHAPHSRGAPPHLRGPPSPLA